MSVIWEVVQEMSNESLELAGENKSSQLRNSNNKRSAEDTDGPPAKISSIEPGAYTLKLSKPIKSKCGHTISEIPEQSLEHIVRQLEGTEFISSVCKNPCGADLRCGHKCSGTCSVCFGGRFHKLCRAPCSVPMLCGHRAQTCDQLNQPCRLKCLNRCSHRVCTLPCFETCVPCDFPCRRGCSHRRCDKPCGSAICDFAPCPFSCTKFIKSCMLHGMAKCRGFCGEPCPIRCFKCRSNDFVGLQRYVLLNDCNHVVPAVMMDSTRQPDGQMKLCPKCQTPVVTTMRYTQSFKQALLNSSKAKIPILGTSKENEELKNSVDKLIESIQSKCKQNALSKVSDLVTGLQNQLSKWYTAQDFRLFKYQLNTVRIKLSIVENIVNIRYVSDFPKYEPQFFRHICAVLEMLKRVHSFFTPQQSRDLVLENERILRIAEFSEVQYLKGFSENVTDEVYGLEQQVRSRVGAFSIFSEEVNAEVKELLEKLHEIIVPGLERPEHKDLEISWAMEQVTPEGKQQ